MSTLRFFVIANDSVRSRAADYICQHAPEGAEIVVREARRDSATNAALHAKLTEIARSRTWAGKRHDVDTWKRLFVAAWSRATGEPLVMLPALDGAGVDIVFRRTSEMTKREVVDLLAYVEAWEAETEAQGV